jgi:hypothetical protein
VIVNFTGEKKPPGFAAGGFFAQRPQALLETN